MEVFFVQPVQKALGRATLHRVVDDDDLASRKFHFGGPSEGAPRGLKRRGDAGHCYQYLRVAAPLRRTC